MYVGKTDGKCVCTQDRERNEKRREEKRREEKRREEKRRDETRREEKRREEKRREEKRREEKRRLVIPTHQEGWRGGRGIGPSIFNFSIISVLKPSSTKHDKDNKITLHHSVQNFTEKHTWQT